MKKYFAALVLFLGMLIPVLAIMSPANAYDITISGVRYKCTNYTDRVGHTFAARGDASMYVQYTVGYRRCVPYDHDRYAFIEPNYSVGAYNVEGSSMSCNAYWRIWDGAYINAYFYSPLRGTNYNPPKISLGCSEDTTNSKLQDYSYNDTPRLFYGPGSGSDAQPRWKVNLTARLNNGGDLNWSHGQDFNWSA